MQPLSNRLEARASSHALEIILHEGSKELAKISIPPKQASFAATIILAAAKSASELSGSPPMRNDSLVDLNAYSNLAPTGVALGKSHIENAHSLVFFFGETVLGLSIGERELHSLYEQMTALLHKGTCQ